MATVADLLNNCPSFLDSYLLYPLLGSSEDENNREIYSLLHNVMTHIVVGSSVMDIILQAVLNTNRLTAIIFPLIHDKVRLLSF